MKVLLVNGSPHEHGCTYTALAEVAKSLNENGVETEIVWLGKQALEGCRGCGACRKLWKCVIEDCVNEFMEKAVEADGFVFGSPVHYASAGGALVSFMDRLFYSNSADLRMKVGAAVSVARRGGQTTTFDQLNKYFTISGMPVASGQYWNGVHGAAPGEAENDSEGLQQMRTLAANMAFLMKSIALGKEKYGLPEKEAPARTNFIR
jgi:multimeric flavodoxin WrbA